MRRKLAAIVLSILIAALPSQAFAAIAFDAATNGGLSSTTSLTYAHTVTGSNTILIVSIGKIDDGDAVTGVTYNGVAMTRGIYHAWPPNANSGMYLYYLYGPATGTHNVVVSLSANTNQVTSAAVSYTGAAQSGTPDTNFLSETASGDRTVSVTVTTANSWLVANYKSVDADPTAAVSATARVGTPAGNPNIEDSGGPVGSGAQTIGYTWAVSDRHVVLGLAFAPAGGGAAATPDYGNTYSYWW